MINTVNDGDYSEMVRMRPFIFQKIIKTENFRLIFLKTYVKSLDDESFFVYRNFASKTVTTGSITFTVPETESFAAICPLTTIFSLY